MKNEISEFFEKIEINLENVIGDSKSVLLTQKVNDPQSFVFLSIIYEFVKESKIEVLINNLQKTLTTENVFLITNFIKEEQMNITDYFSLLNTQKEEEMPKLIDFEWKFVSLSTIDKFEVNEMIPKILLKLLFNNGSERIIETDYSNLKKLQEEVEECCGSFNSTYARRIETFAK